MASDERRFASSSRSPDARMRWVAGFALGALVVGAIAAPLVAPYAPDALDLLHRRAAPDAIHWFGSDELGRDVLTRVLFGARISLAVGLLSAAVAGAVGLVVGAVSGYAGGAIDAALMRLTDAALSIPRLPLLMIAAAILEPPVPLLIVLIGLAGWMETARVVRTETMVLGASDFVSAARAAGARDARIIRAHLVPNILSSLVVAVTLAVGRGILIEAALSFFGVGVQPPVASWGNMLYQAQATMRSEPWLAFFPGCFIFAVVLLLNVLGSAAADRQPRHG